MTNDKNTEKIVFENPDGELYDVYGAFDRHPALTGRNADTDILVELNPSYELEFTIRVGAGTMARLIQILNAAPVNGDPLQAIVNLDLDTTANEAEREALVDYLSGTGHDSTLENVAAGYLYDVGGNKPLEIDVVAAERKEYAVTRVWSKSDSPSHVYPGGHRKPAYLNLKTPDETVTITSEKDVIHIEDLEGAIIGNGTWRILHALEPGGRAPLGGFILERTS